MIQMLKEIFRKRTLLEMVAISIADYEFDIINQEREVEVAESKLALSRRTLARLRARAAELSKQKEAASVHNTASSLT